MATKAHQFIAELVARRMRLDGFEIVSFEGHSESENALKMLPPTIKRHRPDLIGIKRGCLSIGEAKTSGDIGIRTHEQIEDYVSCINELKGATLAVYIGVPSSIENRVRNLVASLTNSSSVIVIGVPDRLLPQD